VVYAASTAGGMVAINGADGTILWDFESGGSVVGGAAISRGQVFWESGYSGSDPNATPVMSNNQFYAF
jgi:polyvinyl alcohol dehydrogenase (cytochrome)